MKRSCLYQLLWFLSLLLGLRETVAAGKPIPIPAGTPVTIAVVSAAAPGPSVTITLGTRQSRVTPFRQGLSHTGGGNVDVAQPSADTVVVTLAGVAVAVGSPCRAGAAGIDFDLQQRFDIVVEKPAVKSAKLSLEARVIGLLRSQPRGGGSAVEDAGSATVSHGGDTVLTLSAPEHAAAGGTNLSVNDHAGPISKRIVAGQYTLHLVFHIAAAQPRTLFPCKGPSAELAPDPALDPLWISYWEPFHGASKKDFGFQVSIKVAPDS